MKYTDEQKKVYNFVQFDSNHGAIDELDDDTSLFDTIDDIWTDL